MRGQSRRGRTGCRSEPEHDVARLHCFAPFPPLIFLLVLPLFIKATFAVTVTSCADARPPQITSTDKQRERAELFISEQNPHHQIELVGRYC